MRLGFFLIIILILSSCEDFYNRPQNYPPPPRTNGQTTITQTTESNPTTQWGVVRCQASQFDRFQQEIRKFLRAVMNPSSINVAVSCVKGSSSKGGFFIKGQVLFENSASFALSNFSQKLDVSEESFLDIHIVGADNRPIKVMNMPAVPYAGAVDGNIVSLTFSNESSTTKIFLDGTVENAIFSGLFKYINSITYRGVFQESNGIIGHFSIPACSLLNCADTTL